MVTKDIGVLEKLMEEWLAIGHDGYMDASCSEAL